MRVHNAAGIADNCAGLIHADPTLTAHLDRISDTRGLHVPDLSGPGEKAAYSGPTTLE